MDSNEEASNNNAEERKGTLGKKSKKATTLPKLKKQGNIFICMQ